MPNTATYRSPLIAHGWFRDHRHRLSTYKRDDETFIYTATTPLWDLTDALIESETVSSATWSASGGLSATGTGNNNTSVYATITNTGYVDITVTTSASRILKERFHFLPIDEGVSDY